jgi:hypothetical protein
MLFLLVEPASAALEVVLVDYHAYAAATALFVIPDDPATAIQLNIMGRSHHLSGYGNRELHTGTHGHIRVHLKQNTVR